MKDLRFIKHDADSYDDDRFTLLLKKEGFKGYGIYWALMENLFGKPGYQSPLIAIQRIASRFGLHTKHLMRIITEYGLFEVTDTHFGAPQLANCRERTVRHPSAKQTGLPQESEHNPKEKSMKSEPNSVKSENISETFCPKCSCNPLEMNDASDRQEKTREEKEKRKNTHTEYSARGETDFQKSRPSPPAFAERTAGCGRSASPPPAPAAGETEMAEKARQFVQQLPRQQVWLRNIAAKTPHGSLIHTHLKGMLEEFLSYLCLMGEEATIRSIEDAKRRFFLWTRSKPGTEYILRFRKSARQNDPYAYEQLIDGRRTYLGRPIPDHAPPRPDDRVIWDERLDKWIR